MIIQTVSFSDFCDSFSDTYKNNFTHEGKKALFEYLEDYSDGLGEDIELDTVGLCCDYTEYDGLEDYHNDYDPLDIISDIENKTTYIPIEGTERFIIANF